MRLLECEGKALLRRHDIPVPAGAVWPNLPATEGRALVVKAQIRDGGRGKRGGIRFVDDLTHVPAVANDLLGQQIGEYPVERVYIEERLAIARELYLAVIADRDQRAPVLLASGHGGIDIEEVPTDAIVRQRVDPLLGLRPPVIASLVKAIGLEGDVAARAGLVIERAYCAFVVEDAALVEINPLVVTTSKEIVAADARVVVDDAARFRHHDWPAEGDSGTAFERRVAALGGVGVEMDGEIAVIASGAGLMMATVDSLGSGHGTIRAAVDLGSAVFTESRVIGEIVREVQTLRPKLIFVNAFFQLASCLRLAEGLRAGLDAAEWSGPVVVRLAGRDVDAARALLAPVPVIEDFEEACRLAIATAGNQGT